VIGVTDPGLLQRFSKASADARTASLDRLVEDMPLPWPTYREHVARATEHLVVSHKPDHGHEGALHNATAYGLRGDGEVAHRMMLSDFKSAAEIEKKTLADDKLKQWLLERTAGLSGKEFAARVDQLQREHGIRRVQVVEKLAVIQMADAKTTERHGMGPDGSPAAYKGYKGDSNYCIEIWSDEKGKWRGDVVSTFEASQIVRMRGLPRLQSQALAQNGKPLVMRLMIDDYVRLEDEGQVRSMRIVSINSSGRLSLVGHREANVDARNRDPSESFAYTYKMAGTLQTCRARRVTVSPIGDLRDPGFAR
jgi:CRISPR-associated endonuclease Csn1